MSYCVAADVRAYATQAKDTETFEVYIANGAGIMDAEFLGKFKLPLTATPRILAIINAKLAAAEQRQAKATARTGEHSAYADGLYASAMSMLKKIVENPEMIGADLIDSTDVEDGYSDVHVAVEEGNPVFNMGDERTWGE